MIALDLNQQTTSSSPLNLAPSSKDDSAVDFSKLLHGMKIGKKGNHIVQNGILALSLDGAKGTKSSKGSTNNDILLSLLKNEDSKTDKTKELLEINPKLANMMDTKELKNLISNAKKYLKSKILQTDGYKKSQIKELPKTLKNLALLAKKFGIDISKITFQEVQPKIKSEVKKDFVKPDESPKTKDVKVEVKKDFIAIDKNPKIKTDEPHAKDIKTPDGAKLSEQDNPVFKEIKNTPVFKPQISPEHTTEQLVEAKQFKVEKKTPKDKVDETLQLLLKGKRVPEETKNLTSDFSVQTAKVIAPKVASQESSELESLLHDKTKTTKHDLPDNSKIDSVTPHKVDSFEVKLNEAKQMIKYLSQDVKTAIDDYKSPFTRVKVQLNPQRLGAIDLTVVQRGKNLHVNLSSNSAAITTLSMNATELKTQLSNSGINNATLNFNSGSQHGDSNFSGQQNRQNERQAKEEYNYLINEDANEELLNSLEIVIPRYI